MSVEKFEVFMAEMLQEYDYDKGCLMVTTAFAESLAREYAKQYLEHEVNTEIEKYKKQLLEADRMTGAVIKYKLSALKQLLKQ